jgi:hypothetical protein
MKRSHLVLLVLICSLLAVAFVQADQPVPFSPLGNVTGAYELHQGNDYWEINTNFPLSSQDIVYPDWLFGMMIAFMIGIACLGMYFISKDIAPWVSVIACGFLILGLGLAAAEMAPLVGYTEVFHQVVPTVTAGGVTSLNSTNTIYVNEIAVYILGPSAGYACWGVAIGMGFLFVLAGVLLQMKQARAIANMVQAEKIRVEEIDFRQRETRRER